jgi:hypothetical protein
VGLIKGRGAGLKPENLRRSPLRNGNGHPKGGEKDKKALG